MIFLSKTKNLSILLFFSLILGSCATIEKGGEKKDTDAVIDITSSVHEKSKTKKTEKNTHPDKVSNVKTEKSSPSHKTSDTQSHEQILKEEHKKREEQPELLPVSNNKTFPFSGTPFNGKKLLSEGKLSCEKKHTNFGNIPLFLNDRSIDSGKINRTYGNENKKNSVSRFLHGYNNQVLYTLLDDGYLYIDSVSINENLLPSKQAPCMHITTGKLVCKVKGTSWIYVNDDKIVRREVA